MRPGLPADIHNAAALDAAPERMGARAGEALRAGDAVFRFRFSDDVIRGRTRCEPALRVDGTLAADPGSAGQARNPANGFLSCAILDTPSGEAGAELFDDPARPGRPQPPAREADER